MRTWTICAALGVAIALVAPAASAAGDQPVKAPAVDPRSVTVERAAMLIHQHKLDEGMALLDPVIASFATQYADDKRRIYCARSIAEVMLYMTMAAGAHESAIALDSTWCDALFLKGFGLIDLGRPDEAAPLFEKAVAHAPSNSHYLGELAEWHKMRREWGDAYALFGRAVEAAEFSPEGAKAFERQRAWHGMAFVLSEQGKLDDAEAVYRKCLAAKPDDAFALNELRWIEQQRKREREATATH